MSEPTPSKRYLVPTRLPRYGSLATIIREIPPGADVLDVGCSEGYLAAQLPRNRVWGIDSNAEAVAKARGSCVDAEVVDLNHLPRAHMTPGGFDCIVMADVLEHLVDPEAVLRQFREYLRPGGMVIVSVPNIALWRCRLNLLLGRFDYTEYGVLDRTHLHFYTFKTARELLVRGGYQVLRVQGAANVLGPIAAHLGPVRKLASIHVVLTAMPGSASARPPTPMPLPRGQPA